MAFRYATRAESEKYLAKAVATARKWLDKGYTAAQVAEGIWNYYGLLAGTKDGKVQIQSKRKGFDKTVTI